LAAIVSPSAMGIFIAAFVHESQPGVNSVLKLLLVKVIIEDSFSCALFTGELQANNTKGKTIVAIYDDVFIDAFENLEMVLLQITFAQRKLQFPPVK